MKLEKAIELLTIHDPIKDAVPYPDYIDAIKLGIETLKRIYNNRATIPGSNFIPLPEETKE